MARDVMLFLVVRLKLAEKLNGGLELAWREALIAHDENMMFDESPIQSLAGFSIDRLPEIEADHFGAGVFGKRRDCEARHRRSSRYDFAKTLSPSASVIKVWQQEP
jgi:hypothetical protein